MSFVYQVCGIQFKGPGSRTEDPGFVVLDEAKGIKLTHRCGCDPEVRSFMGSVVVPLPPVVPFPESGGKPSASDRPFHLYLSSEVWGGVDPFDFEMSIEMAGATHAVTLAPSYRPGDRSGSYLFSTGLKCGQIKKARILVKQRGAKDRIHKMNYYERTEMGAGYLKG
jgi:hypothetical protein